MRRRGFTLMELLIVILIIGMLIAILLPALAKVKDEANKARCGAVLHDVYIALQSYGNEWNDSLPFIPYAAGNTWNYIGYDTAAFLPPPPNPPNGTPNPTTDAWSNWYPNGSPLVMGNTRALYECLIRAGKTTPDAFICPATTNTAVSDSQKNSIYDFPTHSNISYSYFNFFSSTRPSLTSAPGLPLMADRNPQYTWQSPISPPGDCAAAITSISSLRYGNNQLTDPTKTKLESANSGNHGGSGQNVLFLGGNVKWCNTPLCGLSLTGSNGVTQVNNIYTLYDQTGNSPYGIPAATSGFAAGFAMPTGAAWLAP